ncbi:MAG: amidohydrolase family protein [Anaerolineae bacterium]|nr:amidohydrolase family protein [Anaerolineae bacterium]
MIVDSHTHVFPPEIIARRQEYLARDAWFGRLYANPKARMATAEELISSMDAAGVDVAVTFGFGWGDPGLCRLANDYTAEAIRTHAGRLAGFAVVNPASRDAEAEIARSAGLGLAGIGELMPEGQGYSLGDADLLAPTLEAARSLGWPVLVHVCEPVGHEYPGKGSPSLDGVVRLAGRFPETTLILAHWGGGLPFYELMPEVRAALANAFYDTAASPLLYDDAIFRVAAELAPGRILFGTDYPLLGQKRMLERVRSAGLGEAALREMLGGTAVRLLGLEEPRVA